MYPDDLNAREAARLAEKRRKRDEALAEHKGSCPGGCSGSCSTVYRLKDGEPVDSNSLRDPEVDKALKDLFIGLAIAAIYMAVLLTLIALL